MIRENAHLFEIERTKFQSSLRKRSKKTFVVLQILEYLVIIVRGDKEDNVYFDVSLGMPLSEDDSEDYYNTRLDLSTQLDVVVYKFKDDDEIFVTSQNNIIQRR